MATRVLLIDDDELARYTVREVLKASGYDVLEAENGRKGIALLRENRVDAVVTDIIMPDMEGIETIRHVREIARDMPILAISGGGRVKNLDYLKIACGLGADGVLRKPFEETDFLTELDRVIAHHRNSALLGTPLSLSGRDAD